MRSIFHILIVFASLLLLSSMAVAQMGAMPGEMMPGTQPAADIPGSTLLGKNVTNPQGITLGRISDFLVDRSTGRIPLVLMQSTVTPGYENKLVAIPFQALSYNAANNSMVVNLMPEQVAQAPSFNKTELNNIDRMRETQVYQYYGITPYWEEMPMRQMPPGEHPIVP